MADTLRVVGIGSPHGDDQAGWRVIDVLEGAGLPPHVGLERCPVPATRLLGLMAGVPRVLLVDAVESERPPGTLTTWQGSEIRQAGAGVSCHGLDLATVLALGETLGLLPAELTLLGIGVEPAACGAGSEPLSPAVAAGVTEAARHIAAWCAPPPGPGACLIPPGPGRRGAVAAQESQYEVETGA